jgi:agmatinase
MADQPFHTFAGFSYFPDLSKLSADIAIIGIPAFRGYPGETAHSFQGPDAIRMESNRYPEDPDAWDFDLGSSLIDLCRGRVVDCGNLMNLPEDQQRNRDQIQGVIQQVLKAKAIPVVLGGDDSIPIPVLSAFEDEDPFFILQLDAHIDWRDEVKGIRDGYSSTMRRASEMPWVQGIVQVGARGVGSARKDEYQAALDYGAKIISAKEFHQIGINSVLNAIPAGSRCFLTIDFDVLDPSIMPAVGAPTPGGLLYQETIDLIHSLTSHAKLIGACLVELVPSADIHQLGTITAMRMAWNVIGALAKSKNTLE